MKGLCHVCLASNVEVSVKDSLTLCGVCLKRVSDLEKIN